MPSDLYFERPNLGVLNSGMFHTLNYFIELKITKFTLLAYSIELAI